MKEKIKCSVIILSGGFGKRLGKVTKTTPKPLIKILGKPFLEYVLFYMNKFGFYDFYLATHYMNEKFIKFSKKINKDYKSINLKLIKEKNPLGTGGAVKNCLKKTKYNLNIVINADTLILINFKQVFKNLKKYKFGIVGNYVNKNLNRYGIIDHRNNKVLNFLEKSNKKYKFGKIINTGVFYFNKKYARREFKNLPENFSLEKKIYPNLIKKRFTFHLEKQKKPFLDIGIPSDLKLAKSFIKKNFKNEY